MKGYIKHFDLWGDRAAFEKEGVEGPKPRWKPIAETFHETMARGGEKPYVKGWAALADVRKASWEAAANAVLRRSFLAGVDPGAGSSSHGVVFESRGNPCLSGDRPDMIFVDECDKFPRIAKVEIHERLLNYFYGKKETAPMQEKVTALNNELQVLRGKLEAEQRHASNLRVKLDEANADAEKARTERNVANEENKRAFGMVETHRNERDTARTAEKLARSALSEARRTLTCALDERDEAKRETERTAKANADLLEMVDALLCQRSGSPFPVFMFDRQACSTRGVEIRAMRLNGGHGLPISLRVDNTACGARTGFVR